MDPKKEEKPAADTKPVVKSWDDLRKEAKTQAKEKYAKKLLGEDKIPTAVSEAADKVNEKIEDKPEIEEKPKEEPKPEPKVDVAEVARKAAHEAATKVSEETKEVFKTEVQKILDKDKSLVDKQKELDELIPVYLKENRLPKDYKEMVDEQLRVTEARWAQLDREKAAKVEEEPVKPITPPSPAKLSADEFQTKIASELNDLYTAGVLPRPSSYEEVNNEKTTDQAALQTQRMLGFWTNLNKEITKSGGEPITSAKQAVHLYKLSGQDKVVPKVEQPAGADAPVSPSRNQSTTEQNAPKPFYQKGEDGHYHAKSWAQIKYEQAKAVLGK